MLPPRGRLLRPRTCAGLNRLHQFDKVELVRFCKPGKQLRRARNAPRRRRGARPGARAALPPPPHVHRRHGHDAGQEVRLEVWSAGQGRWLEVSSVSNFEAFQARRANVRFRPEEGARPEFVHTLNGERPRPPPHRRRAPGEQPAGRRHRRRNRRCSGRTRASTGSARPDAGGNGWRRGHGGRGTRRQGDTACRVPTGRLCWCLAGPLIFWCPRWMVFTSRSRCWPGLVLALSVASGVDEAARRLGARASRSGPAWRRARWGSAGSTRWRGAGTWRWRRRRGSRSASG